MGPNRAKCLHLAKTPGSTFVAGEAMAGIILHNTVFQCLYPPETLYKLFYALCGQ